MKTIKWMGIFCISLMMLSNNLQAESVTSIINEEMILEGQYINTSTYNLEYTYIPGFLVAPLQVKGDLLAKFNQERLGYVHEGIDIRAAEGTPIFAIDDGIVTKAAPDSKGVEKGGGHMIFIDFGNGVEGRYMHLSAYGVQAGETVRRGQVIGFTGNTGDSTTPHLHFEYRVNGVPIDPAFIFEASGIIEGQAIIDVHSTITSTENMNTNHTNKESFYILQQ